MLHLKIGEQRIALSGDVLAHVVIDSMPEFLRVKGAGTMQEKTMKSAINGVLPMLLSMIAAKNAGMYPPPDLKSPVARENMFAFAVNYLFRAAAAATDALIIELQGDDHDGEISIIGFSTTPAVVDAGDQKRDCGCAQSAGISPTGADTTERD